MLPLSVLVGRYTSTSTSTLGGGAGRWIKL